MWNIFALPDIGFLGYSLNAIGFDFNFTQQPGDAWLLQSHGCFTGLTVLYLMWINNSTSLLLQK